DGAGAGPLPPGHGAGGLSAAGCRGVAVPGRVRPVRGVRGAHPPVLGGGAVVVVGGPAVPCGSSSFLAIDNKGVTSCQNVGSWRGVSFARRSIHYSVPHQ
ncbi:unnamed protein product, partial [Heterosigma akashiwo]